MTRLMPASPFVTRPRGKVVRFSIEQQFPPPHEFQVAFVPDEDEGGFSVFAVNYPAVISQGDTIEEARANIAEAFMAVLESRRKHGETMAFSYQPVQDIPKQCPREWISING